jgi:hypothetical protein
MIMFKPAKTISVWRFHEAPQEFQALSGHGGDEDWLAFVPETMGDPWIGWLESRSPFGVSEVTRHPVDGGFVYIGAHA